MTITEAVEILNREKWRGRDDWYASAYLVLFPDELELEALSSESAIAIASYLELREACQPFFEAAQNVLFGDPPDGWATVMASLTVADWRKLAALAGERE